MRFNDSDYDIYHLGVSGGKDSTAVLLWITKESRWDLRKLRVSFCDTGNEDDFTYAYLAYLSDSIWPIKTIYPERDFWELARWKRRFPARRARFCTSFLKIIPTRQHVFHYIEQGQRVLMINGVRSDESHASNNRGDVSPFDFDEGMGADVYRPILDWSLDDVWEIHKKYLSMDDVLSLIEMDTCLEVDKKTKLINRMLRHGIPRNPLYDMGAVRVGCFPCINSKKAEIRGMDEYRPERIDFIEQQEGSFDNLNMYSSMFARNTVPEGHRSKEIVTVSGERMKVATIRDVVRWSKTSYGGRQYEMNLDDDTGLACNAGVYCE